MLSLAHIKPYTTRLLVVFSLVLGSCEAGYNLNEDGELTENDVLYHGPSNGAHWELRIDDTENDFSLRKFSSARSTSSLYRVSGSYVERNSGFFQLIITGATTSDIDSNTLTGLRLEDDSVLLFPFADGELDLLALIPEQDTCPSSSRGNSFVIERNPLNNVTNSAGFFIAEHRYSFTDNDAQFNDGIELPDLNTFSEQIRSSDTCENGYATHRNGTNYLGTHAAVLEYENVGTDSAYERIFTIRRGNLNDVSDMDSTDYVGFIRNYEPSDIQFASAECSNGSCRIFSEPNPQSITKTTAVYRIAIDNADINLLGSSGLSSGQIRAEGETESFNTACILNSDLVSSNSTTTQVIACHAIDPADGSSPMSIFLVARN